ncbi:DUF3592 domain-containing protein [Planctomicrobium sp. SH668]|uniref:DUF3592 domain-containing protein n=1 Tax=Planctomicrobium sp. SH668 TaxID=3448126 RepID=UPI003F5BEBC1
MIGVVILVTAIKAWEVWRARNWIPTQGKVTQSNVINRRLKNRRGPSDKRTGNFPNVVYEYEVDGIVHRGNTVNVTPHVPDAEVETVLERYPVGTPVTVYYNPANLKEAVLERDWPAGLGYGVVGLILFILAIAYGVPWMLNYAESRIAPELPHPERGWLVVLSAAAGVFLLWLYAALQIEHTRSRRWPSVKGKILSSGIEAFRELGRGNGSIKPIRFRPRVEYEYQVDGRRYQGDRINFGSGMTGAIRSSHREEGVNIIDRTGGRAGSYAPFGWMNRLVLKYPVESEVDVFYNPEQPALAVLETSGTGNFIVMLFAIGFFAFAIALAIY